jgi:hypothetical protein
MDWQLFLTIIMASCSVLGVATPVLWVLLNSLLKPMRDDIAGLKADMKELNEKVKPIEHIMLLQRDCINIHARECGERTEAKIHAAIRHHEERAHQGLPEFGTITKTIRREQ